MEAEYAVKISLVKHLHDNFKKPYYWSLIKYDELWHQIAFGWEESPEKAFNTALQYYNESKQSFNNE